MNDTFNFNGSIGQFVKEGDGIIQEYNAQSVASSSSRAISRQGSGESSAVETSHVRIAPRKKTSVLVALNAMFKAGWFVAEDGTELTNRDFALNDILRHAFGIDKDTAISQTVNPSNNINAGEKNQRLLRLLLDEDEMESYIKELQRELLDG